MWPPKVRLFPLSAFLIEITYAGRTRGVHTIITIQPCRRPTVPIKLHGRIVWAP